MSVYSKASAVEVLETALTILRSAHPLSVDYESARYGLAKVAEFMASAQRMQRHLAANDIANEPARGEEPRRAPLFDAFLTRCATDCIEGGE